MAHTLTLDKDQLFSLAFRVSDAGHAHPKWGTIRGAHKDFEEEMARLLELTDTQTVEQLQSYADHLQANLWRNTSDYGDMRIYYGDRRDLRIVKLVIERRASAAPEVV